MTFDDLFREILATCVKGTVRCAWIPLRVAFFAFDDDDWSSELDEKVAVFDDRLLMAGARYQLSPLHLGPLAMPRIVRSS